MTSNLFDDVTNKLGVFGEFLQRKKKTMSDVIKIDIVLSKLTYTLPARRPRLLGVLGSLETLLQTNSQIIARTLLAGRLDLWSFLNKLKSYTVNENHM